VDVVLKAFEVCAASQGCMNNITFGEEKWGYYETVAGGAGAVSKLSNVFMLSGCKASVIWN
jgi:N-methylhydantoinase B/oxoprolinase/acetone carboxylase alpha subunit